MDYIRKIIREILKEEREVDGIDNKTKLSIFDFDGTLVNTPNQEDGELIWKEKTGKEWEGNWWTNPNSLDINLFEFPTNKNVISAYNKEKSNPKNLVVMMTGRLKNLSSEVEKILDMHELRFDDYLYNSGEETSSDKINKMELALKYNPKIRTIEMFDDRYKHISIFKSWGKDMINKGYLDNFKINHIKGGNHINENNIKTLLDETHIGQKDLEKFVNNILLYMGDVVVQSRKRNEWLDKENPELKYFPMFFTGSLSSKEYNEIRDFVESSDIVIKPRELIEGSEKTKGLLSYGSPNLNKGLESFSIYLKYNKKDLDEINKMFDEKKYGEVNGRSVYLKLYFIFYSSLLHEIQHAYDAWRSKGKSFNSQNKKKFIEKQKKINKLSNKKYDELTPEEKTAITNGIKTYQNLIHEINARYAETMHKIRIKTVDDAWNEIMNPWEKVYKSFKYEFNGWRNLSDKMKKKLTRRLAKSYQETSENLKSSEELYGKEIADEIIAEIRSVVKKFFN